MARRFERSERQSVEWNFIPGSEITMTADNTFVTGASFAATTRFTLRRLRGKITFWLESTLAAGDQVQVGVGIGVFSTDAVALGATALPDPLGEPGYPWLWWSDYRLFVVGSLSPVENQPLQSAQSREVEIDSKAMRILRPGQSIAMVVQYSDVSGTPQVSFVQGRLRLLLGLH